MTRTSSLCFAAPIAAALLGFALPALADDPIVKLAPTPTPAAGPTVNAATQFCGDPTGKADELIQRYSTKPGLLQVYTSADYIAFSDDAKKSTVMYTFTTKSNPAYPAAVCRWQVKEGDNLLIKMTVVCDGKADACDKLKNDFNVMNAKMQAEVDQQIAAQKK